ncbi:hypothetical protein [Paenibacillus xylanexedens]|uniref:hypothetical protein n=1 Tax=Paenibacillus xylanexedens TaxID=528191 RepID=UPI0021B39286|nr:hypothetical protein [Paenibacillus xylanexedens]
MFILLKNLSLLNSYWSLIIPYVAFGIIGAGLMITTVPTVVIYLLLNKQVQKSMIAGAIKG